MEHPLGVWKSKGPRTGLTPGSPPGQKTAAGKALVALNSVAHGIYSVSPVIDELESKRSWTAYRFAMLDCLAPVGMVEMTLAERVTLAAWRLRRVARFEAEQIRLEQEDALEEVSRRLGYKLDLDLDEAGLQQMLEEPKWREERLREGVVITHGQR